MNINVYIIAFLIIIAILLIFSSPKTPSTAPQKPEKKVSFAKENDVRITPSATSYPQTKFSNDVKIDKERSQMPTMDLDQVYKSTQAKKIIPMDDPYSKPLSAQSTRFSNEKQDMISRGFRFDR